MGLRPTLLPLLMLTSAWPINFSPPPMRPTYAQNINYHVDPSYGFVGYLKQGGEIRFHSSIYTGDAGGNYVRLDDQKLFGKKDSAMRVPADFDSLFMVEYVFSKNDSVWTRLRPDGDNWLIETHKGRISLYQGLPDRKFTQMEIQGQGMSPYDQLALNNELNTHPGAKSLLQWQTIGTAVGWALLIGGAATLAVGLAESDHVKRDAFGTEKHEFNASPLIAVGAVLGLSAVIPFTAVKDNFDKAIRSFNQN